MIDEVDARVGTARAKDPSSDTTSDTGSSSHTGTAASKSVPKASRGRPATERTISHGETVDFRKFLKREKTTVVEFYADW